MNAKKEETRRQRLQRLIESCVKCERIGVLPSKK
jgi:hypothetical protein